MSLYRREISKGIFFNHLATDRFKTGYFSVNFLLPLSAENAAYYAILPRILCRGTRRYPDQQRISCRLEELYGADIATRNEKRGEMQVIGFSLDMLDNAYLPANETMDLVRESVDLLHGMLCDPILDENGCFLPEYVESERRNRIDAIKARINNKQRMALDRFQEYMFSEEAAGISVEGRISDYEDFSIEHLMSCYRRMLEEAHVEIFYVGGEARPLIESLAGDLLAGIERKGEGDMPKTQVIRRAKALRRFEETVPAAQGILVLGFRSGTVVQDEDQTAFTVFNEIYGGSPASKLFLNVREKRSLCYYCYSFGDLLKGTMTVIAGIDQKNRDTTEEEILDQLARVARGEISEDELFCAVQSLSNAYRAIMDSPVGLEGWYLRRVAAGMSDGPEERIAALARIRVEDIARVAQKVSVDTVYFLRGISAEREGAAHAD